MASDLVHALFALAALLLPLGMAWFIVSRHENSGQGGDTNTSAQNKATLH
jgi:hypothetical protein